MTRPSGAIAASLWGRLGASATAGRIAAWSTCNPLSVNERTFAAIGRCRRFEVPTPPDSVRNFKSKSGTRIIELLNHRVASAPLFPKLVSEHDETYHELRKRGTRTMKRGGPP